MEVKPAIMTTDEEREAYFIVRAILREATDIKRVALRDQQSYCGILLDNNNRKPLARLYFNGNKKAVGVFDSAERKEEKVTITSLDDLYGLAPRLKAALSYYEAGNGKAQA